MWPSKLLRDVSGAALVDAALAVPLSLMLTLGTVDAALLLWEWNQAAKATHVGARIAAVSNPVATGIATPVYDPLLLGDSCSDPGTGAVRLKSDGSRVCPAVSTVCTPSSGALGGSCTDGRVFDDAAFAAIVAEMQRALPRLTRQNVEVRYVTTDLGFVGRPGGLPMNVSVSIRCMTHSMVFLGAFLGWTAPANPCASGEAGIAFPASTTTLPTEDLASN